MRPGVKPSDVQLGNLAHHCVYNTYASLTRFFDSRKSPDQSRSRREWIGNGTTIEVNPVRGSECDEIRPFKFKTLCLLAAIGRRTGVAEMFGMRPSGIVALVVLARNLARQTPGPTRKVRVAIDWMLDLIFSKDIVQLPTLRSVSMSGAEERPTPVAHEHEPTSAEQTKPRFSGAA